MASKYRIKCMVFVFFTFLFIFYTVYFWSHPDHININESTKPIECSIYSKTSTCIISKNVVYLPSNEIVPIYDVYGYFDNRQNKYYLKENNILFSKSSDYRYNSLGKFLFFGKYNVELRPKVKLISTDENVPLSIQWSKSGYKYPIQIAQFGLSHYSKWIDIREQSLNTAPVDLLVSDERQALFWEVISPPEKSVRINDNVMTFSSDARLTPESLWNLLNTVNRGNRLMGSFDSLRRLRTSDSKLPEVLVAGAGWQDGSGLHVLIDNERVGHMHLLYACGDQLDIKPGENIFVYAIHNCSRVKLLRNLYFDLVKAVPTKTAEQNPNIIEELKLSTIKGIILYGKGTISTFKISNQFSYDKFLSTADWFVENQDSRGGWPTNVTRRIYANVKLEPGWYSAMAQGHAISVLMRASNITGDDRYVDAASKALRLFQVNSVSGGIRTTFLGHPNLVWYEEYPTEPSLFVLNGFIYSLFGLLDYVKLAKSGPLKQKADDLFTEGVKSLETLLPLFDSGFGSFYDLRHVTFPAGNIKVFKRQVRPREVHDGPNRARLEYHVLHIEQLLYLGHSLDRYKKGFIDTADRFISYLKGFRSSHN